MWLVPRKHDWKDLTISCPRYGWLSSLPTAAECPLSSWLQLSGFSVHSFAWFWSKLTLAEEYTKVMNAMG